MQNYGICFTVTKRFIATFGWTWVLETQRNQWTSEWIQNLSLLDIKLSDSMKKLYPWTADVLLLIWEINYSKNIIRDLEFNSPNHSYVCISYSYAKKKFGFKLGIFFCFLDECIFLM